VRGRPAVRRGDEAILLGPLLGDDDPALAVPTLKPIIERGREGWRDLHGRARERLERDEPPADAVVPAGDAVLPVRPRDYVDFYASREHAENFGRIFRPGQPALRENWFHLPVGYHGRASTVVVSGTPVRRPRGPVGPGELAPTAQLDLECEVGIVCGPSASAPIDVDRAEEHLFGVVLVNDWSARDVQRFEYVPLGPFLGKSFATTISAWVTPLDALAHARVTPVEQDPPPAAYLQASDPWALDLALEIEVGGEVLSRPNASWLYWTPAQMLAHLTVNGAALSAGDLFATGTVSGSEPGTEGSLAEIGRGERWLADGEEVVLRGRAGEVELGEVRGRVVSWARGSTGPPSGRVSRGPSSRWSPPRRP
jgi:fumarylacetoacetase